MIAAGGDHTCAITNAGEVVCWGGNNKGQLGDTTTTDRPRPTTVPGLSSGIETISVGGSHTCVLVTGSVKCWGWNRYGQLGDGTATDRSTPVAVSGLLSGVQAISAGGGHTCALTNAGGVKCWGDNEYGQLGDGTTVNRSLPVSVSGLASGVQAIATGGYNSCALLASGGLQCWGPNNYGQLGTGTASEPRPKPTAVSGLSGGIRAIVVGDAHACALLSGGGVKCWGNNQYGQLGDGTTTDRPSPVAVPRVAAVQAIAVGGSHSCAASSTTSLACWGSNDSGQLGEGTRANRSRPTAVLGLASGLRVLTVRVTGRGTVRGPGIRCPKKCAFERAQATKLVLTELPAKGWRFKAWSGPCKGHSPRCAVVLDADMRVGAVFAKHR